MNLDPTPPLQSLPVYRARDVVVTSGANLGDPLSHAAELLLGDVYGLRPHATRLRLAIGSGGSTTGFRVADGSETGTPGHDLHLDAALTFMCPDGSTSEALVFVEVTRAGAMAEVYLLPLSRLEPRRDYALVSVDREGARARLAQLACVSFARGTRITLSNGLQRPIEDLVAGDRVLTRDNGVRAVRWIGSQTVRATGALAPILIAKGALNNSGDLMVSPNHRLFIYQRRDHLNAGRAEVLVRARYLVNGETVVQSDGGFVDYFQLLFDRHEIIYAEGIAAESLLVDTRVGTEIPTEDRLRPAVAAHHPAEYELDESVIDAAVAADLLRRASAG